MVATVKGIPVSLNRTRKCYITPVLYFIIRKKKRDEEVPYHSPVGHFLPCMHLDFNSFNRIHPHGDTFTGMTWPIGMTHHLRGQIWTGQGRTDHEISQPLIEWKHAAFTAVKCWSRWRGWWWCERQAWLYGRHYWLWDLLKVTSMEYTSSQLTVKPAIICGFLLSYGVYSLAWLVFNITYAYY